VVFDPLPGLARTKLDRLVAQLARFAGLGLPRALHLRQQRHVCCDIAVGFGRQDV
jgi:hypothetical protein